MGSIGSCCCGTCVTPDLIESITFDSIEKVPADWLGEETCCPFVSWTGLNIQLSETIRRNDAACTLIPTPAYYCVRTYLTAIHFYFSKFSCNEGWWVAMKAEFRAAIGVNDEAICPVGELSSGTVSLYREKFVSSITAPTTITFTADDHYDWTAEGACHEYGECPTAYTGEIESSIAFCCGTILDPNCADDNIFYLDWTANDFSFEIA